MDKSKQKLRSWGCVQEKPTEGKLKFLNGLAKSRNVGLASRPDVITHLTGEMEADYGY